MLRLWRYVIVFNTNTFPANRIEWFRLLVEIDRLDWIRIAYWWSALSRCSGLCLQATDKNQEPDSGGQLLILFSPLCQNSY